MRRHTRSVKLLSLIFCVTLLAASCGSDSDDAGGSDGGTDTASGEGGGDGELVDLGTFTAGTPSHIDPGLTSEVQGAQVATSLYDGLTDIDFTGDDPVAKPLVAETVEKNEDASVWTFTLKADQKFSDGEPVTPESFVRGWERASDPDFAADYGYLFGFIKGGDEKLAGDADKIEGLKADEAANTLEVTLKEPYANFDYIVSFQIFSPMPSAVDGLGDQSDWENGVMVGNGPFVMAAARSDQEIVLERNPEWGGNVLGDTETRLAKITFRISQDIDSAYSSFEASEGDTAALPSGRVQEAVDNYATTLDDPYLGSYHFDINMEDPAIGGPENKLLRQAVSMAIDREDINQAVYDGTRTISTGITPEGIPGWEEGLCEYCAYDEEGAKKAFEDWKAEGNSQDGPLKIQFNTGSGHEDVIAIMVDNLKTVGIQAEAQPIETEVYFDQLRDGACQICRAGWIADYPTYDNFMFDLFDTSSIGGNNLGPYSNPDFDKLVADAKKDIDPETQGESYREAENLLLNEDVGVIPLNWYRGTYVYNPDTVKNFEQVPNGLINWDRVEVG